MQLLKNYQQDILKSRTTPLLIELSKTDLNKFGEDGLNLSFFTAQKLYDIPLENEDGTNLIFIDGNKVKNSDEIFIFEELLSLLEPQIDEIKNLVIVKKAVTKAISMATGGVVSGIVGEALESGLEIVLDSIHGTIYDILIDNAVEYLDIPNTIIDEIEGKAQGTLTDSFMELFDVLKEDKLYLTHDAKQAIEELSHKFNEELSPAQSFRLILQLIISISIDMQKIIFVKNPHKLDKNSLAILSLLYSFSKDLKDDGKHTGISVIYAYDDEEFQPYKEVKDEYKESKILLDEQRLYTQRYAMLERPTSDIPRIAVKSHMFVGREEELKHLDERYFYSKEHNKIATLETVFGEPGIGKTKLVKKHLHNIRKKEEFGSKMIQLSLLNQVGHSSSNTGLSSLIDSIVKESSRLENARTFTEVIVDKAKEYATDSVTGWIKGALGVNKLIDIVKAVDGKVFLEARIEKTLDNSRGDQDNKSSEQKQQQFTALTLAIRKLQDELSDDSMPIVLFVDDLQWIDEDSAEYIVEHFIKRFNVHIVATIRPSDATTMLGKVYANREQNPYTIALLKKVDIQLEEELLSKIDTSSIEFDATHLKGLNKDTLTSLIAQVIKGDKEHQEVLAQTIIKQLNNDKTKDEVNTLFAVETINMLCDEKLYTTQKEKIEQLIITEIPLKFNEKIKDFQKAIEETFEMLDKKHKKAFEHINWDKENTEQKFNLMAYAVLEERLGILKVYFKEHGNAAVNTLLFSSLLGTPFNSSIVKNVLESLATTEEELLQPLKEQILEIKSETSLTEVHYEIIEEVYEILSRYRVFSSAYAYRHSLLNIFLEKQLEYQLKGSSKESKDKLFVLILKKILEEKKKQDFYEKHEQSLNTQEYANMLFFRTIEQNVLRAAYTENLSFWAEVYTISLNNLAHSYKNNNRLSKAIELGEESVEILKPLYQENSSVWAENYTTSLNNLQFSYYDNNQISKAIELGEESVEILKPLYQENPSVWAENYTTSLNNLAGSYKNNTSQIAKAIELEEESLNIRKKLYQENPSVWAENYTTSLNNLADSYKNNTSQIAKAIELEEESLNIRKKLYQENPSVWAEDYITALINLAYSYKYTNQVSKAIVLEEESLEIVKKFYKENQSVWAVKYAIALTNLAGSYLKNNQLSKVIELEEKSLKVQKSLYQENPPLWVKKYTEALETLAASYSINKQLSKAIELEEESLEILKPLYQKDPSIWADEYRITLNSLTAHYEKNNQLPKVIKLEEESLEILKQLYQENPSVLAKNYTTALNNLVNFYRQNNQILKAIELEEDSLEIVKSLYKENPSAWAEKYIISLNNLITSYSNNNQVSKAIELKEESLEILKPLYQEDPSVWEDDYIESLHNLALSYAINNQFSKSIELEKESLKIVKAHYQENPSVHWVWSYAIALESLADFYRWDKQFSQSIELKEESLRMRKALYKHNPSVWTKDYTTALCSVGASYCSQKDYTNAEIHFKEYFTLLDIKTIDKCEDLWNFISPFVKYYQAVVHSEKTILLEELERLAEESIEYFKNRFGDEYTAQMKTEYEGYIPLRDAKDSFDNEKYEIFRKIFLNT